MLYAEDLMVIALSMGGTAIESGSQGEEEIPSCEHVKYKNSSICSDSGSVEDVWKGPLCCLSCRN